jgi:hypothetical protein
MSKRSTDKAKGKKNRPKTKLGIPDLEHSKAAVLKSLGSPDSRRGYRHAIDEFVAWYCSEPRLALNKTVVFALSVSPGGTRARTWDDQRANGCRATAGLLGGRLRSVKPRVGRWHPPCQRCSQTGFSFGQLAYGGRGVGVLASTRRPNSYGKA